MDVPAPEEREGIHPSFTFLFYWALKGLDDAYPHWCGQIFFTSLLNQMLTSSKNSLTGTPKNNVLPAR